MTNHRRTAKLALEDGTVFSGFAVGSSKEAVGEVVFNTAITGYQEILTDPSYRGQIVTMTYPEIGNYGVNQEDVENKQPWLSGFIVRQLSRVASNYRSEGTLSDYLAEHDVTALAGIDTRALVRRIRTAGALKGIISETELDDATLVAKAVESPGLVGRDLVREVMSRNPLKWETKLDPWTDTQIRRSPMGDDQTTEGKHVVCMDFGMKWNIARHFASRGNQVTVVPGDTDAATIERMQPDGIFLSNGPGDPEPLTYAHETIKTLLGKFPIFGICLGHQVLAIACGAKTFKLKFGHRGVNQPVQNLETGQVEITTQNHGFAVEESSLPDCLEVTHRHLNDDTIAGLRHREHQAFCVQYHPEAASGPHDSHYLFDCFQRGLATSDAPTSAS